MLIFTQSGSVSWLFPMILSFQSFDKTREKQEINYSGNNNFTDIILNGKLIDGSDVLLFWKTSIIGTIASKRGKVNHSERLPLPLKQDRKLLTENSLCSNN